MLADVAAALGMPFGTEGDPTGLHRPLPPGAGPAVLGSVREALLDPAERRRRGAHYTPMAVASRLAALALDGLGADAVVADPACGGGAFLLAAADVLVAAGAEPAAVVERLIGVDTDPLAIEVTTAVLHAWAGAAPTGLRVGDGLDDDWTGGRAVDAVVGNPPFLSPLGAATARSAAESERLRVRFGAVVAAYADSAGLFLLSALGATVAGGRVVLVQPESLLASRDGAALRRAVLEQAALEGLWVAGERVFGAGVRVCAPVLRTGRPQPATVRRYAGAVASAAGTAVLPPASTTWAPLRPTAPPPVRLAAGGVLADLATATAGFRDEFYGLSAATEETSGPGDKRPPLITSGLLDPGRCAWGERPARIAGRNFAAPVVDRARLDPRTATWVEARLGPKVLVATQTKVVEAAADAAGRWVPLTPVIAVAPIGDDDPATVWRIAALLTSPAVTAWALHHWGGTALATDAVKLSARQILTVPLPADLAAWAEAAALLEAGDVAGCAAAMNAAHGAPARLLPWWEARLRPSRLTAGGRKP